MKRPTLLLQSHTGQQHGFGTDSLQGMPQCLMTLEYGEKTRNQPLYLYVTVLF